MFMQPIFLPTIIPAGVLCSVCDRDYFLDTALAQCKSCVKKNKGRASIIWIVVTGTVFTALVLYGRKARKTEKWRLRRQMFRDWRSRHDDQISITTEMITTTLIILQTIFLVCIVGPTYA